MRTVFGILSVFAVALLLCASMVSADERAEVADLQARIAALEAKMMAPAAGGDAEALSVAKGKGQLKIMGDANVTLQTVHMDERNLGSWVRRDNPTDVHPSVATGGNLDGALGSFNLDDVSGGDNMDYTAWTWEASLKFRVDVGPDAYLHMKLELEDADDGDDLVEEVYFNWSKVRGSNWSVRLGKQEIAYGQDMGGYIADCYVHGGSTLLMNGDFFGDAGDGNTEVVLANLAQWSDSNSGGGINDTRAAYGYVNGESNPHAVHGIATLFGIDPEAWQGEVDNALALTASYKFKDLATLELTSFQNPGAVTDQVMGYHEDRPEDQFQSYAARLTLTPVEGLTTTLSYINRHMEGFGDAQDGNFNAAPAAPEAADYLVADTNAFSLGFTYNVKPIKTTIFGEYVYDHNMGYMSDTNADIFQLGAEYQVNEKLSVMAWWEMVRIDNGFYRKVARAAWYEDGNDNLGGQTLSPEYNSNNDQGYAMFDKDLNESIQRVGLGAKYTCDNGIAFSVEYLYEWYQNDLSWYKDADAHSLAFRTEYSF